MKKIKYIAYIILVLTIVILFFILYTNITKNSEGNQKRKTLTEIEFVESKLVNLFNTMNNINFENYKLEVSKEELPKSTQGEKKDESSDENNQENNNGGNLSGGDSNISSKEEVKKFELIEKNILTDNDEINWDSIKSEVETLYTSIPSITLDLYQVNINQEDILGFNKEYDNLTKVVKEEQKKETLAQLSILYDYIPKFVKNVNDDLLYQITIDVKSQILKAYSKLEDKDWISIKQYIQNAVNSFNQVLTTAEIDTSKQYSINKSYIMINELQNAVLMEDETIFLIKYKNLLEELNNM